MQGSFATYLRCGRVVNSQIKKRSCRVCQWNNLKIGEYLEKLPAKRGCLVHFLGHLAVHETTLILYKVVWQHMQGEWDF